MSDLTAALMALRDKHPALHEAEEYARGCAPEIYTTGRLRQLLRKTETRFRVNWCRTSITAVLNRLEISSITVPDNATAQAIIDAIWEANRLDLEAGGIHESALEYGETYVIVWEGAVEGTVDIHLQNPKNVQLFYDPEDGRTPIFAVKRWDSGGYERVNLYYPDRIERYISVNKGRQPEKLDESQYIPFSSAEGEDSVIPNPYGQVPVFRFRTGVGSHPEHKEAYGPQSMLNKLTISQMSTVDYAAFPQRYALLEAGIEVSDDDPDGGFDDDDSDDTEGLTPDHDPALVSHPGSLWPITGAKGVGQFAAADPRSFLEPESFLVQNLAAVTETPLHLYQLGGQVPSGASRRAAELPLRTKVGHRQNSFAASWKDVFKFALLLAGLDSSGMALKVTWARTDPMDDADLWKTVEQKVRVGVPAAVALVEAGYTTAELESWQVDLATVEQQIRSKPTSNATAAPAAGL